jgi:hypothetical protein
MSVEEILAKLKTLEVNQTCAACGNDRWETQGRILAIPADLGSRISPFEGMPCVARLCTHCGYVALHATEFLKKR